MTRLFTPPPPDIVELQGNIAGLQRALDKFAAEDFLLNRVAETVKTRGIQAISRNTLISLKVETLISILSGFDEELDRLDIIGHEKTTVIEKASRELSSHLEGVLEGQALLNRLYTNQSVPPSDLLNFIEKQRASLTRATGRALSEKVDLIMKFHESNQKLDTAPPSDQSPRSASPALS